MSMPWDQAQRPPAYGGPAQSLDWSQYGTGSEKDPKRYGYGPTPPAPTDNRTPPPSWTPSRPTAPARTAPAQTTAPNPAPTPGSANYLSDYQKYLAGEIDHRNQHIQSLRDELESYKTPEGRQKFADEFTAAYVDMQKKMQAAGVEMEPLQPGAMETALARKITALNQSMSLDDKALKDAQTSLTTLAVRGSPAMLQQANAKLTVTLDAARTAERQQAERAANPFGFTNAESEAFQIQQNTLALNTLAKSIDLDQYTSTDEINRKYTIPRQMLIDRINVANNLMQQEEQRNQAALTNDRSVWETLHNGAMTQWSNEYAHDVSQRGQDMTAVGDMSKNAAEMARAMMPFVIPRWQLEQLYGRGSALNRMGMPAMDFDKMGPPQGPSYQQLMNAPQAQWQKMMGTPGLPGHVGPPPFDPGIAPDANQYLQPGAQQAFLQSFYQSPSPAPSIPTGNPYQQSQQMLAGMPQPSPISPVGSGYTPSLAGVGFTPDEYALLGSFQQEQEYPQQPDPSYSGGEE